METISQSKPEVIQPAVEVLPVDQLEQAPIVPPGKNGFGKLITKIKEKYFPPDSSSGEIGDDSVFAPQVDAINKAADVLTASTWHKVEDQLGSNEGGWFKQSTSDERFYVKFYADPNQAKVEYIANAIYARLGINAVASELIEVDGRQAIASLEIPSSQPTYREEQRASSEVREGFVADAYLANWDVVGLNYDNIIMGEGRRMYRVDNGGALIYRAQGGKKAFSADDIPELQTMLNPDFTAGQIFKDITQEEMAQQAKRLIDKLDIDTIELIVAESELSGEMAQTIRDGLIGRRAFLIKHFGLSERRYAEEESGSRMGRAIEQLNQMKNEVESLGLRPRTSILSDNQHIENQEISFIDVREDGLVTANFKLTAEQYEAVLTRLNELKLADSLLVKDDASILYKGFKQEGSFAVSGAYEIMCDGLVVKVAKPQPAQKDVFAHEKRSAIGLVTIDIPYDAQGSRMTVGAMEGRVNDVLINLLGVPDGMTEPGSEAAEQYKEARYRWHHKIPFGPLTRDQYSEMSNLERREVFPNYHTMVSPGKHHEYEEKWGKFAPYHLMHPRTNKERIVSILQVGGLLSSHERFRRGLFVAGLSSYADFESGGADSVFVRTVGDGQGEGEQFEGYAFVMDAKIYDRTDWYAYDSDQFGATGAAFDGRQSPDVFFSGQRTNGYDSFNEQMFRTGISTEDIKAIVCSDTGSYAKHTIREQLGLSAEDFLAIWNKGPNEVRAQYAKLRKARKFSRYLEPLLLSDPRMSMIDTLHKAGISHINGQPVERFVVSTSVIGDFVDICHDRTPQVRSNERERGLPRYNDWL